MGIGTYALVSLLSFIFIEVRGARFSDVTSLYDYVTTANYRYIRPEIDLNTPTAVAFKFMLTNLQDLDENTGKISIVGFFEKKRDNNLTWDPLLYDSVNLIILPNRQIWKPYLLLGNPYKNVAIISMTDSTIKVYNNGVAYCHPAGNYEMSCDADVSFFPFDSQTCEMWILPWQQSPSEIKIVLPQSTIDMSYYSKNPQWDYVSSNLYVKNSWNSLHVSMTFKRRPTFFMINIIFPIVLLGVLNLFVFVLPVDSGERIGFGITLLLAIAVFMTIVADSLPSTSSPRLSSVGIFLCLDLIISTLIMICTIFGLKIYNNGDEKPVTRFWITLMKCCNICCFSKKLDTNNKIHVTENKSNASDAGKIDSAVTWKDVGYFLDKLFIVVFSLFLFISYVAFFIDIVVGVNQ
jgi:hypothetical protein